MSDLSVKQKRIKNSLSILCAVVSGLCVVLLSAYGLSMRSGRGAGLLRERPVPLTEGWFLDEENGGEEISLPAQIPVSGDEVTIRRRMTVSADRDTLLFLPERQGVLVTVDGQAIYSVNRTPLSDLMRMNKSNVVVLPENGGECLLQITFSGRNGSVWRLPEIAVGSRVAVASEILWENGYAIAAIICLAVFGVILLVAFLYFHSKRVSDIRIVFLALFLLDLALWTLTDSSLVILTSLNAEATGLFSYFAFMFLPIPILYYVWAVCEKRYDSLWILAVLGQLNILLQAALAFLRVFGMNQMLFVTHALVLATVILCLFCLLRERKRRPGQSQLLWLIGGFVFLIGMAVWTVVVYWISDGTVYQAPMLFAVTIFLMDLIGMALYSYVNTVRQKEQQTAERNSYERLALTDNQTGLGNLRAFERKLSETAADCPEGRDAVLLMIDVNDLKYLNETFGHAAGDELIRMAAECIRSVYDACGSCYRIGGDEFGVILTDPPEDSGSLLAQLEKRIAVCNQTSVCKWSVAVGESRLRKPDGEKKSAVEWRQGADDRMYSDKVEKRRDRAGEQESGSRGLIECVIATMESKDRNTVKHSQRVSELSRMIAARVGLSDPAAEEIGVAARLHDIGKIGVPDRILMKEDALTESELAALMRHPVIGARIVSQAKGMENIGKIILHRYERYDGKGFPDGIAGDDIPIGSRIIAIADFIDTATSSRYVRKHGGLEMCRKELERRISQMYDPVIGRIVLENWSEVEKILALNPSRLPVQEEVVRFQMRKEVEQ